jgi:hypothetical protein
MITQSLLPTYSAMRNSSARLQCEPHMTIKRSLRGPRGDQLALVLCCSFQNHALHPSRSGGAFSVHAAWARPLFTRPNFVSSLFKMKNDEGEVVDLYIPRKWCVAVGLI